MVEFIIQDFKIPYREIVSGFWFSEYVVALINQLRCKFAVLSCRQSEFELLQVCLEYFVFVYNYR